MDRRLRPSDLSLMFLAVVLALGLGHWQSLAEQRGELDPISKAAQSVFAPASISVSTGFATTRDFFVGIGISAERVQLIERIEDLRN